MLIDAEAVEAALLRGYSSQEGTADLVSIFWQITVDYNIGMYVSRTPTDINPSDGRSQCVFTEVESRGASWVDTDPKNRPFPFRDGNIFLRRDLAQAMDYQDKVTYNVRDNREQYNFNKAPAVRLFAVHSGCGVGVCVRSGFLVRYCKICDIYAARSGWRADVCVRSAVFSSSLFAALMRPVHV